MLTRGGAVDAAIIDAAAPSLKLIHVLGRYPDRVDLEAATRTGVAVATMPHGGAMAVADHTLALMLAVARQVVPGHLGVTRGEYEKGERQPQPTTEWSFAFNWLGFDSVVEINRKTLGLIGFGEIGKEVARRARGFDMDVLYYRRRPLSPGWEKQLGARHASLDTLLEASDFVSLHAPHTEQTEGMIDASRLRLMKPSAYLVNTSRGGLVDEAALVRVLEDGGIAGAALDVFVQEPLPKDSPLTRLPNVVLAPHTGGGSGGGQKLLIAQVMENVAAFLSGGQLRNRIEER